MDKAKKNILVIDDDKSILRTFTRILQKNGYIIDVAETGKEALEKADKRKYDLALIDIRLPDMEGTDLLIKMQHSMRDSIKIMITSAPDLSASLTVSTRMPPATATSSLSDSFFMAGMSPHACSALPSVSIAL